MRTLYAFRRSGVPLSTGQCNHEMIVETTVFGSISSTLTLLLGAGLLIFGRKIFWFFVGVVAFVAGMHFGALYLPWQSEQLLLIVSVACGLIGIALAFFVKKFAIGATGFVAGGLIALNASASLVGHAVTPSWLPFIIGGILGAVVLSMLFDWALIVLSSLVGAILVGQGLHLNGSPYLIIVLAFVGVILQARLKRGRHDDSKEK